MIFIWQTLMSQLITNLVILKLWVVDKTQLLWPKHRQKINLGQDKEVQEIGLHSLNSLILLSKDNFKLPAEVKWNLPNNMRNSESLLGLKECLTCQEIVHIKVRSCLLMMGWQQKLLKDKNIRGTIIMINNHFQLQGIMMWT